MSNAILLKCLFVKLLVSEEFPLSVVTEASGSRVLSHGNHSWKKPTSWNHKTHMVWHSVTLTNRIK